MSDTPQTAVPAAGHGTPVLPDDLPDWLPRIALATEVSAELLGLAAASAHGSIPPDGGAALLDRLADAGLLVEDGDGARTLLPAARLALLDRLSARGLDQETVRSELLTTGLGRTLPGAASQLVEWAHEARDFAALERLWQLHSPAVLMADPRSRRGFSSVPLRQRALRPALGYAAAIAAGYRAEHDRLDLDLVITALVREGRTLHATWAQRPVGEAAVVAGTLWLFAESTMPHTTGPRWPGGDARTEQDIAEMIRRAAGDGVAVSGWALSLFHGITAVNALTRGDWPAVRRHAELAMLLNENCGVSGFLGALAMGAAAAASGNTQHSAGVQRFIARHLAHDCRVAAWLEPAFHLVRAEHAIRQLDRATATSLLRRHEAQRTVVPFVDFQPLHAWIHSLVGVLWGNPESALAHFDAIAADARNAVDETGPWSSLLLRSRAQLLLAMGSATRARRMVDSLRAQAGDAVAVVPTALLSLGSGELPGAIVAAEDGIYSLEVSLAERAQLYAIRAAALALSGGDGDAVAHSAAAACTMCSQCETLVPFAQLPPGVRSVLLADHETHHGSDCFVSRAIRAGAFSGLSDGPAGTPELVRLTPRERVLLPLLGGPATVREIADELYVSVNTVRKQVVALRAKLGASSRAELVRRARELGLE